MTHEPISSTVKDAAEAARDLGANTVRAVKSGAAVIAEDTVDGLRSEATVRAEAGKHAVADQGLRLTAAIQDRAARTDGELERRVLTLLAGGVADMSEDLRHRSVESIYAETERFARQNPGAFIAGAAIAGFALARFARASDRPKGFRAVPGYRMPPSGDGAYQRASGAPEGHAFEFAKREAVAGQEEQRP